MKKILSITLFFLVWPPPSSLFFQNLISLEFKFHKLQTALSIASAIVLGGMLVLSRGEFILIRTVPDAIAVGAD